MSLALSVAATIICTLTGCHGRASVHVIPLDGRKISRTKPLIERITPRECYFWSNEKGELCIAMRSFRGSILGERFEKETIASFALGDPPAGSARNYAVSRRTARVVSDAGLSHTRAASLSGIVTVWNYGGDTLRGRFRFSAKQQAYSVLVGWGADSRVLFMGEFTAVCDRQAGEKILERTQEQGMERLPPQPKPRPVHGPPRTPPKESD